MENSHDKFFIISQVGDRYNFLLDKETYRAIDTIEQKRDEMEGFYIVITVKAVPRYSFVVWTTQEAFLENIEAQTPKELPA